MSGRTGSPGEVRSAIGTIPADWLAAITADVSPAVVGAIESFVAAQRAETDVYPPADEVFAALRFTPITILRAVIVGQDPYHQPDQAHGLAFSVPEGIRIPPSLRNIRIKLHDDLGIALPPGGSLVPWAGSGVLLLNTALTVRRDEPGSHAKAWASFTDAIIRAVADIDRPIAFLLWGNPAQAKARLVDESRHVVVKARHPSPLSAHHGGFLGTRPFSTADHELALRGQPPIEWSLA